MKDYREKLREYVSGDELEEIDDLVSEYKTTHKLIYECLHDGLTVEETCFLIDTHHILPLLFSFQPCLKSLRVLFHSLAKDKDLFNEVLSFVGEYHDALERALTPETEKFMVADRIVYEVRSWLHEHDSSLEALRIYLNFCIISEERQEWWDNYEGSDNHE